MHLITNQFSVDVNVTEMWHVGLSYMLPWFSLYEDRLNNNNNNNNSKGRP